MPDYPQPDSYYSGNYELSQEQFINNFWYIAPRIHDYGFTNYAIACMCGAFSKETWFNPGAYQGYRPIPDNPQLGYGIIQWTPATIILNWLSENGLNREEMEPQLQFLCKVEMDAYISGDTGTNRGWYSTSAYPLGYDDFANIQESDGTIEYFVKAFFYDRLRGGQSAIETIPERVTWGEYFWSLIKNIDFDEEPQPPEPPTKKSKFWLYMRPSWADWR